MVLLNGLADLRCPTIVHSSKAELYSLFVTIDDALSSRRVPFAVRVGSGGASGAPLPAPAQPGPNDVAIEHEFGQGGHDEGLVAFIVTAIGFGFISLLTPCVFPMIPVTISYFLKQGSERPGQTLKLAIIYCLGIVGAFTVLGLLLSIIFGPTALNQLANNPWLNLFFAAVFTVFALMFDGHVRDPCSVMGVDMDIQETGIRWRDWRSVHGADVYSGFLHLHVCLCRTVSGTCGKGQLSDADHCMVAFSTAFASPFFFLALFPSLLANCPRVVAG